MGRGLKRLVIEDYLGERARIRGGERAILVEVVPPGVDPLERLAELVALAQTAGATVVATTVQRRERPDPATYIGKGKVLEVQALARERCADTLIFGIELTPAQARNLEEYTGLKIIDRSQLILDIFALHAGTKEAALAVELAQLQYLLPRLRGWGQVLSDTGGIVGTMGPGETRLEQSRRAIKRRIQTILRELKEAERGRDVRRSRRRRLGLPQIALVGYTNSGKSTLFNALAKADALVADKLFATLDTKVRRMLLPDGRFALLADTVGFIRDLPPQLIPAFQKLARALRRPDLRPATEEEIAEIGAVPGYASPIGIRRNGVKIVVDDSIPKAKNLVAGANREGFHLRNVNFPRDFQADIVADVAVARDGDCCPRCGGRLRVHRAIELGHIFKLGTKYSEAMGATFLDRDGKPRPLIMGCYGIGVGRLLAAVIEAHHDEEGIIWPENLAPFQVIVSVLDPKDPALLGLGEELAAALAQAGWEVLLDDREQSPGEKFHDAKLLGIPVLVVVGPRAAKQKKVELERRRDGAKITVAAEAPEVVAQTKALLSGA
jgi:GTP-binding protein HflX